MLLPLHLNLEIYEVIGVVPYSSTSWLTNIQASVYIGLTGYLYSKGYLVNIAGSDDNVYVKIAYPDELKKIEGRTIAIDSIPSPDMIKPNQLGLTGWDYRTYIASYVYSTTDRDIDILLFHLTKFFNDSLNYYNWDIAVTGGYAAGSTDNLIDFKFVTAKKIRTDISRDTFESNELYRHKGVVSTLATLSEDKLL